MELFKLLFNYKGKMTDKIPAWIWQVVYRYAYKSGLEFCKISDYFKEKYGRKKPKVFAVNVSIEQIDNSKFQYGNVGEVYKFIIAGTLELRDIEEHYHVNQEGLISVSEVVGQVLKHKARLLEGNGNLILEV